MTDEKTDLPELKSQDELSAAELKAARAHRRFDRTERLVGERGMAALMDAHVVVVGVGGVGGYAIECLVRSGIGELTIIDFDDVCITNSNRQIHTLRNTVGESKVAVMAERARLINPRLKLHAREVFYEAANEAELLPDDGSVAFVVDAIDNVTAKCALLDRCRRLGIPVVAAMGAAARLDSTKVRVADLRDTYNDPFARSVRGVLRRKHGWDLDEPTGVLAVFSIERPTPPATLRWDRDDGSYVCVCPPKEDRGHDCDDRRQIEGTFAHVVGAFGMACASVVLNSLAGSGPDVVRRPDRPA
jgi:tRNA threonylcarbamoyladenosine dehydratase